MNAEPSGTEENYFDFANFIEDKEIKEAITKLFIFTIEASSSTLRQLKKKCVL